METVILEQETVILESKVRNMSIYRLNTQQATVIESFPVHFPKDSAYLIESELKAGKNVIRKNGIIYSEDKKGSKKVLAGENECTRLNHYVIKNNGVTLIDKTSMELQREGISEKGFILLMMQLKNKYKDVQFEIC